MRIHRLSWREGGIEDFGAERHCHAGSRQEGQSRDRSVTEAGAYQHREGGFGGGLEMLMLMLMLMVVVVRCWRWRLRCGCRCSGRRCGGADGPRLSPRRSLWGRFYRERYIYRYTDIQIQRQRQRQTQTENHSFTPLGLPVFDSLWHIYK